MQKTSEQLQEWQEIWGRKNAMDRFIDIGRSFYNLFFKRILRKYLTPESSVTELGCGRASLTLSLAPEIKKLVGIDNSDVALQQATEEARRLEVHNATFVNGDCTNLDTSERFDFAWSQGLLEHFEDPAAVARSHFNVLKPGGTALMSVPYRYSYHHVWYILTRPALLRRLWPWTEQLFMDRPTLLAIGKSITPNARVFFLQPFLLGIVFLELRKDL